MFTNVREIQYKGKNGLEHIWFSGEAIAPDTFFAAALLGRELLRVRFIRGSTLAQARYQLVDGGNGTLPYHSWIVAHGDEAWPDGPNDTEARTILEPFLAGFSSTAHELRLVRPLRSGERIFGLGERTGPMNKRGHAFPIWNIDPHKGHDQHTLTMYTSIPFYLGLRQSDDRAYGVLVDTTGRVEVDMGRSVQDEASMTVEGDSMVIYFFTGPTPHDVLRQYSELTGHMPLPPRWALGHQQCRWSYTSEQQVRKIAEQLRARHHPCDAIWLDIDYMNGYRNFTWDPQTFPQPAAMIDELHAQNLRVVTIVDPGTKVDEEYFVYQQGMQDDYFCRYVSGDLFTGNVWPGACVFPDFSRSAVRTWWGNMYKLLLDQGVDGIWNDMDEPALTNLLLNESTTIAETKSNTMDDNVLHRAGGDDPAGPDGPPTLHKAFHNAYGMQMARATYEGLLRLRPNSRPFVLTRSGTAGMQRYAALWTGDNWSRWEDILLGITMCLNIGMSGVPFVGVDIGGFWESSNGELLVRFAQLGAFLPFCRNHSAFHALSQEPWAFGEPYESAYRTAMETRYRLLPYLYTLFQQAATSGAPIMRPLYYHYPHDERACDREDEFLVGDTLLSAPVYEEGATSRKVYLPAGNWFDYWDGTAYPGNGESLIPAPLERWPLLVRGNSILPSGPVMQYTDQVATDPFTFTCYMATDGLANFTLYEDDGATFAYQKGASAHTSISCRASRDGAEIAIEEQFDSYRPQREAYEIIVYLGGRTLQKRVPAGQGKLHLTVS